MRRPSSQANTVPFSIVAPQRLVACAVRRRSSNPSSTRDVLGPCIEEHTVKSPNDSSSGSVSSQVGPCKPPNTFPFRARIHFLLFDCKGRAFKNRLGPAFSLVFIG